MNQIGNIQAGGSTTASPYANPAQTVKPQDEKQTKSQQLSAASGAAPAAAQTVSPPGADYSPAYTVEISEEGAQLSSQPAPSSNAAPANAAPTGAPPAGPAPSGAAAGATRASETDADDDTGTTSLASYSDSQLQQMLTSGAITQSEYSAEIARREAAKQAAASDPAQENTLLANIK
ncbi:MAG: hypothetical protein RIN56_09855 [Sporomusaceae bacterium]|nr:hypothetical protein [Sporomusaceae bacterium]